MGNSIGFHALFRRLKFQCLIFEGAKTNHQRVEKIILI